jgi:exosortase/archaeosortase family protein
MMKTRYWPKLTIVLSAIPLALFANILRVAGTGILAHFYGSKVARGFLHEFSGLVVFAFGFVLLFIEYSFLNKLTLKKQAVNSKR